MASGQFPVRFITGPTAIIQLGPWGIAYNSDKVSASDAPKDWLDVLNPKFKGQLLIADPRSSDSILNAWSVILDVHGEAFFARIRDMNPRRYTGNVPAANALAAGEGIILMPSVGQLVQLMRAKGAPIADKTPPRTTGVEMQLAMTHGSKAKHPNAARLFANYVMTAEGNKVFNADAGSVSVFDTANLPPQYERAKADPPARKELVLKLLGFQ